MSRDEDAVYFGPRRGKRFRGLSNFHRAPMVIEGREYATVEHFFQASKSPSDAGHELVRLASHPKEAKKLGRSQPLRDDWEDVKVDVMREGLLAKFRQRRDLRLLLLSTGEREIHEDAPWDDEWGHADGRGRDLLGKLLVEVRDVMKGEFPEDVAEALEV